MAENKEKEINLSVGFHEKDFARSIEFIIQKKMIGVVNVVSPQPISNIEFMKKLQKIVGFPFGIPINAFLLKIGSFIIRNRNRISF